MKTDFGAKEVNHLGHEFELIIAGEFVDPIDRRLDSHTAIARFENEWIVVTAFDPRARAQRQGEIHRRGAGVKKIKRPDINGPSAEIGASWSRRFDDHK